MKTLLNSSKNEVKVVNQLMTALNFINILSNEEEVGSFVIQAIKNIPNIETCCICIKGLEIVIGDSSQDAENILELMINTPTHVADIYPSPAINKELEIIKLKTSDRRYGYFLFSIKSNSKWIKPLISNFLNVVAIELERRWQKKELEEYNKSLEKKVKKRTIILNKEIEKRIKSEISLRKSQNLLAKSQEITRSGSWSYNYTNKSLRCSDEVFRIYGYEPQEFEPSYEVFLDSMHPEDRAKVNEVLIKSVKNAEDSFEVEHRVVNKTTGEIRFVVEKCIHQKDTNGRIVISYGIVHDITEVKQKSKLLLESELRFKDLFEKSSDALLIIKNNIFTDCNVATVNMLGYSTKDKFLQVHPSKLSPKIQPDGKDSWGKAQEMMSLAYENGSHQFEWIHTKKNKKVFPVEVLLTTITNEPNNKVIFCVWRDITKRKKANENLITSYNLINSSPVVAFLWDGSDHWNTKFVSQNVVDLLGYSAEEFLQNKVSFKDLIHPEDFDRINKELNDHYQTGHDNKLMQEYRVTSKDGTIKWLRDFPSIEKFKNGNIKYYKGVLLDITDQINSKEKLKLSEEHYRNLFNKSPIPLWEEDFSEAKKHIEKLKKKGIKDFKKHFDNNPKEVMKLIKSVKIVSVNKQTLKLHEVDSKENLMKGLQSFFTNESIVAFKKILVAIAENKNTVSIESEIKTSKGNLRNIKLNWNLEKEFQKTANKVILSTIDITKQKKSEEKLKVNLTHLDNAQKIAGLGYSERNLSTGEGFWSEGLFKILGIKPTKVNHTALELINRVHPDHLDLIKQKYQEIIQAEGKLDLEVKYFKNNGSIGWIHVISETKKNKEGVLIQHTVFQDIGKQKKESLKLKESKKKLKEALEITQLGSFEFDDSTDLFETSELCDKILGIDKSYKKDIQGWINLVHPDDIIKVQQYLDNTNKDVINTEFRLIRPKDKKIIWIQGNAKKEFDKNGVRIKITGTLQDISKRIKAKEKLRVSEDRWQFAIDGSNLGLWDWNLETDEVFYSSQWKNMLGFNDDELQNNIEEWGKRVHPDDIEKAYEDINAHLEGKSNHYFNEHRILCKDNTYKWILDRGKIISFNKDGKPLRMIGTHTDISLEKEALEKTQKYSKIVKESLNEIYLFDATTYKFIDVNKSGLKNLGYTHKEILEMTPLDIKPDYDLKSFEKLIKPLKDKKVENITIYTNHQRKDRSLYPVEIHLQLTTFNNQDYFSAFILDITKKKKIELALLESEKKFRTLITNNEEIVFMIDKQGKFILSEGKGLAKLGLKPGEVVGKNAKDVYVENPQVLGLIEKVFKGKTFTHNEKVGDNYMRTWYTPNKNQNGEIVSLLGMSVNITEEVLSREALKKSEEKLSIIFNELPLGIAVVDSIDGTIYNANPEHSKITGIPKAELNQTIWRDFTHPNDVQEDLDNMDLLNAGKISGYKMNKRYIHPDNSIMWVNMTIAPLDVADNTKPIHLCITEDITEQKNTELNLMNSQKHLETAQEIAKLGYFESNITTYKTRWSDGMFKILGYTPYEIEPTTDNFHKQVHPDDLEMLVANRQNASNSQGKIINEFRLIDKSGQLKWLVFSGETKKTDDGELIIKGIIQDITSRKEVEGLIIREKELLKAIIDKIPVMLTHYNPEANMLNLNAEFENKIGWKTEEVQDIDMMEKVYPDPDYRREALEYMKKANSDWKEFKVMSKSGDIIDSEWSNFKLEDGTQIGIGIDIRERKKIEMEISLYQNRLEEIVENRTMELTEKNIELDKAMKVFVGRELKIRELQRKINQIEKNDTSFN